MAHSRPPADPLARTGGPRPPGTAVPPGPGLVRVCLRVAYDGSGFHGFALQPGQATVAGALAGALAQVVGHQVRLTCAGRTDAGVHAWGQVVHFDVDPSAPGAGSSGRPVDPVRLARSCNAMLGPAVVVRDAAVAPEGFDARRSALSRRYRYQVLESGSGDPALAATTWHLAPGLDRRAMEAATDPLLGQHDFSSFCRRVPGEPVSGWASGSGCGSGSGSGSLVRRVLDARWVEESSRAGRLLVFEIEATSFCHQMVRSLVGTLVEVGRGRRRAGDMSYVLACADRALAASPAPARGLCLWAVRYPPFAAVPGREATNEW